MKKLALFLLPAVVALMATACSVTELEQATNAEPVEEEILVPKTFLAGTAETRTMLEGTKVCFSKGESISIWDGSGNRKFTANEAGNSVSFSGNVSGSATEFYAMSPYSESTVFTKTGSTVTAKTSLASVQAATPGSFADGLNISAAKSDDRESFSLVNVMSVAKFTLASANLGGHDIVSVELSGSYPLAGDVVVTCGETITAAAGANTVNTVKLANADGSALTDGTYYMVVLPNAGGQVTIKFTASDGYTATKTATLKSAFSAGTIKNLGTVKNLTWEKPKYYFRPVSEVTEGTYLIVSDNEGALLAANGVVLSSGNTWGYPQPTDVTDKVDNNGYIVLDDISSVGFSIAGSTGKFTIQQLCDDYYWYQSGNYSSISIASSVSSNSYYSITRNSDDGTFKILSNTVNRYLQYSTSYKSFGSYSNATGIVPTLYKLEEDPSAVEAKVTLTTLSASGITSSAAVLTASYSDLFPLNVQEVGFYYGTSASNLSESVYVNDAFKTSSGSFSASIASLADNTTYYFRATMHVWDPASKTYKEFMGEVKSFTTSEPAPLSDWKGWLELPANTLTASNYIYDEQMVGSERNYAMSYDTQTYAAMWVAYPLYSATMGSTARPGNWSYNDHFSDAYQVNILSSSYGVSWDESYGNELYARGHQIPNADRNINSTWQHQTFLVTNSTPQIQNRFNGSIWGSLEDAARSVARSTDTLYVATGPVFRKVGGSETIKYITPQKDQGKSVPVPNYYWKVFLKVKRTGGVITKASAIGFWFVHRSYDIDNESFDQDDAANGYPPFFCSVDLIESYTGLDLFVNLPDDLEVTAEANTSWTSFKSF